MRARRHLHEAAHKLDATRNYDAAAGARTGAPSLNDAAHKLEHLSRRQAPREPALAAGEPPLPRDDDRDIAPGAGRLMLALGALGVVYGDIGTSPLYTEQVIFTSNRAAARTSVPVVYGVASLIFWQRRTLAATDRHCQHRQQVEDSEARGGGGALQHRDAGGCDSDGTHDLDGGEPGATRPGVRETEACWLQHHLKG